MAGEASGVAHVGEHLRGLRAARGLSMSALAARAGVGQGTLSRWESGRNQPRLPELAAVLDALGATDAERKRAVSLVEAPRARLFLRGIEKGPEGIEGAPEGTGGDLLRAMRMRRGWTLAEAAGAAGVNTSTLSRWERGETWPSGDQLHALCYALGAHEEEVVALTCGRFSLASAVQGLPLSVEEAREAFGQLAVRLWDYRREGRLYDLQLLALEARLREWVRKGTAGALPLLTETYARHGYYLACLGFMEEAGPLAHCALDLAASQPGLKDGQWGYALFAVARTLGAKDGEDLPIPFRRPQRRRLIDLYKDGLGQLSEASFVGWAQIRLAESLAGEGEDRAVSESDRGAALEMAESAHDLAREVGDAGMERSMRQYDRAKLILRLGGPAQAALPHLFGLPDDTYEHMRVNQALGVTTALLRLGDRARAHDWLQRGKGLIDTTDYLDYLRPQADALARQL